MVWVRERTIPIERMPLLGEYTFIYLEELPQFNRIFMQMEALNTRTSRNFRFKIYHVKWYISWSTHWRNKNIKIVQQLAVMIYINPLLTHDLNLMDTVLIVPVCEHSWLSLTPLPLPYSNLMNIPTFDTTVGTLEIEPRYLQLWQWEEKTYTHQYSRYKRRTG
jgi:hypothetical protein